MRTLRAALRLLYIVATIGVVPLALLYVSTASLFGPRIRLRAVLAATPLFGQIYLTAFGVRLDLEGARDPAAKIFVANHVSYVDIFVAAASTGAVFVSRHDVKDWPLFGWFARMAGTVFLDRTSIRSAIASSRGLVERAAQGGRIMLFPEGGILPGDGVKPFRPFLLAAAVDEGLAVQPLTITYTHFDGHPVDATTRDLVEWHDTPIHTHAWRIMKARSVRVQVSFGETMRASSGGANGAREFAEELRRAVEGMSFRT